MHDPDHTGVLYLIPVPLAPGSPDTLAPGTSRVIHRTTCFIVENARTARRFIKSTNPPYRVEALSITELDKHGSNDPAALLAPLFSGKNIGVMSEAGCPGIADPGSTLVHYAHDNGIRVVPLTGPSSILLALMASGLEGQRFQFHGYLSPKKAGLASDLRKLEDLARREKGTQIFIETPYRNLQIFEIALHVLAEDTMLCVAADLTGEEEWIRTFSIGQWKQLPKPDLHKRPAVFCIGSP